MTARTKISVAAAGVAAGVALRTLYRSSKERDLNGDVVLITGGSRGLGLVLARRFAAEGCKIAICARDEEELARAREDLQQRGASVTAVQCDVTRQSDVERMIAQVTAEFGRIDILVNNAGVIQVAPVQNVSIDDFESAMGVMFWGTVYPTMALLPELLKRNRGHIVNITSIGAKVSVPHLLPYSSAKYAAAGFSEGLRSELHGTGVMVTTIAPGLMRTGSYNAAKFKGKTEDEARWFSLGAALPGISMDANRAGRQIVAAVKRGDAEKILTTPATVMARVHSLAPGITQDLLGWVSEVLLPRPGADRSAKPGWSLPNLRSPQMRGLLLLGRIAAKRLNQRMA